MKTKPLPHLLFLAGVALVTLHAIDDAFLQPQPGTSAGDHLSGGFVPLVLAALSVLAFARVRPGWRAALAFAWSLGALVSGIEAVYYAQHGGLSGDDFSGLLAMAAAPVLVAVGVVELWRSRRSDGRPLVRYGRRVVKAVIAVFVVSLTAIPFGVAYVSGHVSRAVVPVA